MPGRIGDLRIQTTSLLAIAVMALGATLYWLRPVLVPFVLALFFVSGMTPILTIIEHRFKAPRMVAVLVTLALGLIALGLVWLLIWVSVADLANNADAYQTRLRELFEMTSEWVGGTTATSTDPTDTAGESAAVMTETRPDTDTVSDPAGDPSPPITAIDPAGGIADPSEDDIESVESTKLPEFISRGLRDMLLHFSSSLMEVLSSGTIVIIFVFFLLIGGSAVNPKEGGLWQQIDSGIRQYIVAKTMISVVTGIVFGFVLWLFGIPLALVFGMLAFLLNFIPNIGPIIASLLPIPLIILHPEMTFGSAVVVIVLTSTVQFISGNVVEPKLMGDSFDLDPIAILLALMFWGMIWGIVGMFLATPILAALKILFASFESTRPVAELLAGRMDLFSRKDLSSA